MATKYHGTACKTCRRRGRKCTKELPKCRSCLDKGIDCEGYAFRWAGVASRGKLAGKKIPSEPETTTTSRLNKTNNLEKQSQNHSPRVFGQTASPTGTIVDLQTQRFDFEDGSSEDADLSPTWTPSAFDQIANLDFDSPTADLIIGSGDYDDTSMSLVHEDSNAFEFATYLPPSILDPYNIPMDLKFILNYHLLEVAPKLCVDNSTIKNPYSQYILPLAVEKASLMYACAALAACHLSVRLINPASQIDCLRYRGKSMRRLQEQLWSEKSAKDEGNLATVLMLTLTDMCLGGFSNFDAHFAAAKRLIDLRGRDKTQDNFVEQYIAWLDIMSAASNSRKPRFSSTDVTLLTGSAKDWSHDVFPMPLDQFAILSDVVEIYKSQPNPALPTQEVLVQVEAHKNRLLTSTLHVERGSAWLHLTEAYKHAIALYIIRLFGCRADEDEVDWLTQSVIYHAKSTPSSSGWANQLLWPLFHAGLELRDGKRKQWLREKAVEMQLSGGFRNVETAMETLEQVWSTQGPPDYLNLLTNEGLGNMLVV